MRDEIEISSTFGAELHSSSRVSFLGCLLQQSATWMALVEDQHGRGSSSLYVWNVLEFFSIPNDSHIGRIAFISHGRYQFLPCAFDTTRFPVFN